MKIGFCGSEMSFGRSEMSFGDRKIISLLFKAVVTKIYAFFCGFTIGVHRGGAEG